MRPVRKHSVREGFKGRFAVKSEAPERSDTPVLSRRKGAPGIGILVAVSSVFGGYQFDSYLGTLLFRLTTPSK